ncbi:hypothetical protein J7444_08175 [Labrenzia sp. R4_1]|uniref:hypothetical protein n=1 Tax=Labrenzia sp. R4_1 TaxID=2821106 RepID=UPI001ADD0E97|nr:hypothetical protein [Labrenzia sp. R4_1]MBO9424694.1 hypothetical protein [Labrenzia sp. R4_1]
MADTQYIPDQDYSVHIKRVLEMGPIKLLPRHEHKMKGAYINRIIEEHGESAIDYAYPV